MNELAGIVIVNKPSGMTSHDVVSRLRRIFGTKKVGHAGTLDPMATGVLVTGINRGTKFLTHVVAHDKRYIAEIALGVSTITDDREGEIIATAAPEALAALTEEGIREALESFRGKIMQRPAAVSAIKIDGKRAYQRVRDGEEVDIPPRPVEIFALDVLDIDLEADRPKVTIAVHCSSGTYIRAIARDLGEKLGVGGMLTSLCRTSVGPFGLHAAYTLEDLEKEPQLSYDLDAALQLCYPVLELSFPEARALSQGKWLAARGLKGIHAAVDPDRHAVALVKESGSRLSTIFVARPSTL
ncbi:MAG: tRNA pseudouridine(55) synthase TruB [Corynebacterium sp.]|nr:tRNA pseudouridine(55) synthase TruB [Corynebacterium sp.]